MNAQRLREAAQKIRDTAARRAAARRGDSQDYEWQEARQSLMLLGFTREDIALAVADWLDAIGKAEGAGSVHPRAITLADLVLGDTR